MKSKLRGVALEVATEMEKFGTVQWPSSAADVAPSPHAIYLVANGEDVLQLGQGSAQRARRCMRGELAQKHNKAFICAMGEVVLGAPNVYAVVKMKSAAHAKAAEKVLHAETMKVRTNKDGATRIRGIPTQVIRDIHLALWARVKESAAFASRLDAVERELAEELFELVTYGTTVVTRTSGKKVTSNTGDNLEGNILMCCDRRHLANVFMKLSDTYLRYGIHKLTDAELAAKKAGYTYARHGAPFKVFGRSKNGTRKKRER